MRHPASQAALRIVVASLVVSVVTYGCQWTLTGVFFGARILVNPTVVGPEDDELETALKSASMENKTLIISVLNSAYAEDDGMLDLFLRSLREGEDTEHLIEHLLLVSIDQVAFSRCELRRLHCYRLFTNGTDFSEEAIYMSADFIDIMWRRTLFLGDVLRRGYNFIFTDMDVLWLRNPFAKLSRNGGGEDLQISCDSYNGHGLDESNPANTGFYFAESNDRTVALFDQWYERRRKNVATKGGGLRLKEQDVLSRMKSEGALRRLNVSVKFLDTLHFSGFCEDSRDFREVRTVHANCCRTAKAKLADLAAALAVWKTSRSAPNATWPAHRACEKAWQVCQGWSDMGLSRRSEKLTWREEWRAELERRLPTSTKLAKSPIDTVA